MKIIQTLWVDGSTGIVKVETETGIEFFIGSGFGFDEKMDEIKIANWGSRLDTDELIRFFKK